jgi:hypothetical protein
MSRLVADNIVKITDRANSQYCVARNLLIGYRSPWIVTIEESVGFIRNDAVSSAGYVTYIELLNDNELGRMCEEVVVV